MEPVLAEINLVLPKGNDRHPMVGMTGIDNQLEVV
jgi:hypothetical protein